MNGKLIFPEKYKKNSGRYDTSRGSSQVDYAGSVRFGWSEGTRGAMKEFHNSSGHYKPSSDAAYQSGLPLDKFRGHINAK